MIGGAAGARSSAAQPGMAVAGVGLAVIAAALALSVLAAVVGLASSTGGAALPPGDAAADLPVSVADIPAAYLRLYVAAARAYGMDWAILAAIGRVECDHGRDPDRSCTHEGSVNGAGAGGPMQFLASTWATYGVDGDGDGRADRWDAADAVFGAANYLRASGVATDPPAAIFAYNHSASYVATVESWANRYRDAGRRALRPPSPDAVQPAGLGWLSQGTRTPVLAVPGEQAELDPGDGHVALIPLQAPPVVQAMLVAGNELQELAYGPDGHPDPRFVAAEDCSSSLNYVLYRAGIRPLPEVVRENPLAQDYTRWGAPGPGRWVTIYATRTPVAHVFVVIAGLRLDTSHHGTDIGPNRLQDGPRWRILDHIPDWAHWSVRHPPGL